MSCGYVEVNKIEFTGLVIQSFMILNMFLINYFQGCHTSDGFGYFGMIGHFACSFKILKTKLVFRCNQLELIGAPIKSDVKFFLKFFSHEDSFDCR